MADLLIKNIEMPKNGKITLDIYPNGEVFEKRCSERIGYANAIELPPHGEKCCGNCRWCREGHYEEEGEQPYIKRKCTNKYGLTPNYSVYEHDYCSRWEASE